MRCDEPSAIGHNDGEVGHVNGGREKLTFSNGNAVNSGVGPTLFPIHAIVQGGVRNRSRTQAR